MSDLKTARTTYLAEDFFNGYNIDDEETIMEYAKGKIGRIFTVRIDHGEDLIQELTKLSELEHIKSAVFILLGALQEGKLVTGPKESIRPPDPIWIGIDDTREILGIGNIFLEDGKPKFHIHVGAGRKESVKLGCLRGANKVFMVVEVFVFELEDFSAIRIPDEAQGFSPVSFGKLPESE
jgi:predicted DNA-binding protein with PD1-like motif